MLENASIAVVWVFTHRVPRINFWSKQTYTPCIGCMAAATARRRFPRASDNTSPMGICDPVIITGFSIPASIKLSIEAVYAIVSVPWVMTMPSQVCNASCTAFASTHHSSGCMLLESKRNTSLGSTSQENWMSAINSRALSVGRYPASLRVQAIVPPVASNTIRFLIAISPFRFT